MRASGDASPAILNDLCWPTPVLKSAAAPVFGPGEERLVRAAESMSIFPVLGTELPACAVRSQHGCCLYPSDTGVFEFNDVAIKWFFYNLFTTAADLCKCQVSAFDLHHCHWWLNEDTWTTGLLFHAREFPRMTYSFPHFLGFCQQESSLLLNGPEDMWHRNVLFTLGDKNMYLLDAAKLASRGQEAFHTIDESIFGSRRLADVYMTYDESSVRIFPFKAILEGFLAGHIVQLQ